MFRLFTRTRIKSWELEMLRSVLQNLPQEYSSLLAQIDEGVLKGVLIGMSDIPGLITFTYTDKIKKYEKRNELDFKIVNVKVYDKKIMKFLSLEMYVISGCISGYTLEGVKNPTIDVKKIDPSSFNKVYFGNDGFNLISHLLNEEEKQLIQPSEVYSIILSNKEFFHIADTEDGDFIGIDVENKLYKITHDPYEIVQVERETLKKYL